MPGIVNLHYIVRGDNRVAINYRIAQTVGNTTVNTLTASVLVRYRYFWLLLVQYCRVETIRREETQTIPGSYSVSFCATSTVELHSPCTSIGSYIRVYSSLNTSHTTSAVNKEIRYSIHIRYSAIHRLELRHRCGVLVCQSDKKSSQPGSDPDSTQVPVTRPGIPRNYPIPRVQSASRDYHGRALQASARGGRSPRLSHACIATCNVASLMRDGPGARSACHRVPSVANVLHEI